jgi:hypothetical protein
MYEGGTRQFISRQCTETITGITQKVRVNRGMVHDGC